MTVRDLCIFILGLDSDVCLFLFTCLFIYLMTVCVRVCVCVCESLLIIQCQF